MITIENLTKKFGSTLSLDHVSLKMNDGDSIALMGPNGAGKTTLIRLLLGYYHPDEGRVDINGLNPIKDRIKILSAISFVPQLPPPIKLSVEELMQYVCNSSNIDPASILRYADAMELNLSANLKKSFFKLSGGMKQKMLIAVSFARKSDIMIFDEPTANLDPRARDNFYQLLSENNSSKIALFVTHRIDEMQGIVNRQIYMDLGKVVDDQKI